MIEKDGCELCGAVTHELEVSVVVQLADGVEEAEWRPMGLVVRPRHCVFFVLYTGKVATKVFIKFKKATIVKCLHVGCS